MTLTLNLVILQPIVNKYLKQMNNFNENWVKTVHNATQNSVRENANLQNRHKFNSLWQNSEEQNNIQNVKKNHLQNNEAELSNSTSGLKTKDSPTDDVKDSLDEIKQKEDELFFQKIELAKQIAFEEGVKHGIELAKKEAQKQQVKQDEQMNQIMHQLNLQLNSIEQQHMAYWVKEATSFAITLFEKIFQEKIHEPRFWLSTLNNMIEKFPTPKPFLYVYASDDLYQMLIEHSDEIKEKIQIQKKHSLPEMTIEVESNQSGYSFCAKEILTAVLEKIHINKNENE